ncbi:hypothetical protein PLESTB_000830900 [Pleodorina starrii]|uniref:Uncharacterized protein n=1 Tax=Pleodorina starrii TaxID=330485 RepID=A0A9W6F2F2_9CHLO|nr:hypothetical protein PLESTB_000830500 [Pleodorina starrii]GLC54167.1 hypothetical protein PLESTB_000830900 [Pleodorina starrii]
MAACTSTSTTNATISVATVMVPRPVGAAAVPWVALHLALSPSIPLPRSLPAHCCHPTAGGGGSGGSGGAGCGGCESPRRGGGGASASCALAPGDAVVAAAVAASASLRSRRQRPRRC